MGYLELAEVNKTFFLRKAGWSRSPHRAVIDVSFDIPRGKTFGLVGESGSGKTTIAQMIVGLLPPDSGRLTVGGQTYQRGMRRAGGEYLQQLSVVFQNPFSSLDPKMDVFHLVSEPLRVFRQHSRKQIESRVSELLETVGLSNEHMRRYGHEFSGGQRQRIAIARAICMNPRLLILDEPTSALDVSVQAKIINLLTRLQAQHGMTYLFISHNMGIVRHVSDLIGVLYRGRLLEKGDAENVIISPAHPYTRYLIAAVPRMGHLKPASGATEADMGEVSPEGCPFLAKCQERLPQCAVAFPKPTVLRAGHIVHCHLYN